MNVPGLVSNKECQYLRGVAAYQGEGVYVDLGTFHGRSALHIAQGIKDLQLTHSHVVTIDMFTNQGISSRFRKRSGLPSPELILDRAKENALEGYVHVIKGPTNQTYQLHDIPFLFIDADHSYLGCFNDWTGWRGMLTERAEVAFHDSNLPGVAKVLAEEMDGWHQVNQIQTISVWRRV